jgi:hypothetical protein
VTKSNSARDYSSNLAKQAGFDVIFDSISSDRHSRILSLSCKVPEKLAGTLDAWKKQRIGGLRALGFENNNGAYERWTGEVRKGIFYCYALLANEQNPHYVAKTPAAPKVAELPQSVAEYITKELGWGLEHVAAHRHVNGDEPLYAVLMQRGPKKKLAYWLVVFVGSYVARRPLGPYEEAYEGNARLDSWSCLYDAEDWEHSVERFKNAPYRMFLGNEHRDF